MSWLTPQENLSVKAQKLLIDLASLYSSEASSIAELLNEVAEANADQNPVPDEILAESAQDVMNWAAFVIRQLGLKPEFPNIIKSQYWAEDKKYPLSQWQHEVENDYTRRGYWDWVEVMREDDDEDES